MKKIFSLFSIVSLMVMLQACEFHYPEVVVVPDPVFEANGLQKFHTIAVYDETDISLQINRTYGLSKEIEMQLEVDETLIQEYNGLYSTKYELMPSEFFEMPATVTFKPDTKQVQVPVKVSVDKLVSSKGFDTANKMIIPIRIAGASMEIEPSEMMGKVLVGLNIDKPTLNVPVPAKVSQLEFIPTIPLPQSVQLSAKSNFTTLDVSKIEFTVDPSKVAVFNEKNGTDYRIVPEGKYSLKAPSFNQETLEVQMEAEFDCSSIGGTDTYVLPLVVRSSSYVIAQEEPVYVLVSMSELRIWPSDGGQVVVVSDKENQLEVQMNSPMTEDQRISFRYDPAMVDAYNAANGTSYKKFDAQYVSVTESVIKQGGKTGQVNFTVDMTTLGYDSEDKYLVPLKIDEDILVPGTIVGAEPVVYVELNKTATGVYTTELIPSSFQAFDKSKDFQNVIYLADGKTPAGPEGLQKIVPVSPQGQKYAVYYNKYLHVYFDISDEEMPGHPGCVKVINLRDREQGYDAINYNNSYFNPETCEFVFDFITLGWWGPGGGGGKPLDKPGDLPGELWCAKLSGKM